MDLNKDNVVWVIISLGKLFQNDTPLYRITFDVAQMYMKFISLTRRDSMYRRRSRKHTT